MDFIKNVLAVLVGLFCFAIVVFFGTFMLFGVLAASSEKQVVVKDNSVLRLNLKGEIHEQVPDDPFGAMFDDGPLALSTLNAIKAIEEAKSDDKIKGLYIRSGFFAGGYASLRELREAILSFKESGKFVYAYGEFYTEKGYYLASVADKIFLNPAGSIEFNGISANVTFFKGAFEKLGVEPQIFRVGEFKSAIEPLIREDLSPENRLQLQEWLSTLNDHLVKEIAEGRGIEKERLMEISNSMLVTNADKAKEYGLATDLLYSDGVKDEFYSILELEEDDDVNFVTVQDYYKNWYQSADLPRDRIAVLVAEGDIISGKGNNYQVGSDKFIAALQKIRENKRVKAMVVRINSPGGGLVASDVIWNEIMLTKEKMPVIASMSDYATSGGYYLAMPCDTIVSHPTTLTGSIGIFATLFNFGPLLNDKMGITHDVVKTGEYSDIFTVTRSLSDQERAIIQREVELNYDSFIEKAAQGRNTDPENILNVASGRIWPGSTALNNGLVDVLGGFNDALELAASAAEIDEYRVVYYPAQKTFIEELVEDFGAQAKVKLFGGEFAFFKPYEEIFEQIEKYRGIQARLPYELRID